MKIGEIGDKFTKSEKIDYQSDQTFMDYDLIIVDLAVALLHVSVHSSNLFRKRKADLGEFLQHKKMPLVLFAPLPQDIPFPMRGVVGSASLDEILPIPSFSVIRESGKEIVIVPNTPFTEFFTKYMENFHYESVFLSHNGVVTLEAPYTKKVLAFYNADTIILPPLKKKLRNFEDSFFQDLLKLIKGLNRKPILELPAWSEKYQLPYESETVAAISEIEQKLEALQLELSQMIEKRSFIEKYKILFTGSGANLEDAVRKIFEEMGFDILPVEQGRHDLIMRFGELEIIGEIKGVAGSGTEKQAAQLQKWVGIYHADEGRLPKGLLIVNSFNDKELVDRTADSFPNQMLPYAKRMGHCLLTTLQLMGLYYAVQQFPTNKDELIHELLNTVGEYAAFKNWTAFITISPAIE